jgi:hypothetical protein
MPARLALLFLLVWWGRESDAVRDKNHPGIGQGADDSAHCQFVGNASMRFKSLDWRPRSTHFCGQVIYGPADHRACGSALCWRNGVKHFSISSYDDCFIAIMIFFRNTVFLLFTCVFVLTCVFWVVMCVLWPGDVPG